MNKRPPAMCGVYLVSGQPGHLKIGVAKSVKARMSHLRSGASCPLVKEHEWRVPGRTAAFAMERSMHLMFKGVQVRGEWFSVEPRVATAAGNALLEGREADALRIAVLWLRYSRVRSRQQQAMGPLFSKAAREASSGVIDRCQAIQTVTWKKLFALGVTPDEWDVVLGLA